MEFKHILTATLTLFAVIDIFGSLPIIIDLKQRAGKIKSFRASLVAMGIMIAFLFLGEEILKIIGLDIPSFAIAGAFVIFFLALEMILGIKLHKDEMPETVSIVPIAFPLIAGTGVMTTLLSLRSQFDKIEIIIAIVVNIILVYIVLINVKHIERFLGPSGVGILRKVFGILLLAISVKIFKSSMGI
ncbi:MAG: MarC family protein [Bacteroidia bacterium]|nr:MarC family protein [Bacteroidia bacterium]